MAEHLDRQILSASVTDLAKRIAAQIDGGVVLCVWPESMDGEPPVSAMFGNPSSYAAMMRRVCDLVIQEVPRPADCEMCAAAWDAIAVAHLALTRVPEGKCQ
jgi:hypothetical protein